MAVTTKFGRAMRTEHFTPFSPENININHGSFGAYPATVRDELHRFQALADSNPDGYFRYELPRLLDRAREVVAELVKVPADEVVLVPNATMGVNTVLRNLRFAPGDKIVYLSTAYGACEKTVDHVVEMTPGLEAVRVEIAYPISDDRIVAKFEEALAQNRGKVRVAMFDTVSSLPGIRLPFERLTALCRRYGALSLIDGAHGLGCVPLDLGKLDADFFVSNLHKWLFVPRSCAMLHVPKRNQHLIKSSLPTSHGYVPIDRPGKPKINNPLPPTDMSAFLELFAFVGTMDYAPYLCVPAAVTFRRQVCGGEEAIMAYCNGVVRQGAQRVAEILGTDVLGDEKQRDCPMAMVRLPIRPGAEVPSEHQKLVGPFIERSCFDRHHTFVPVTFHNGNWWVRLSGQIYLDLDDFDRVGQFLYQICNAVKTREPWSQTRVSRL